MPKCILAEQGGKGGGGAAAVVPTKLVLKTNPSKLTYRVGDTFSLSGFTGTVQYGVSGSALSMGTAEIPAEIPLSSISCSPDGVGGSNRALQKTDTAVTIYYVENGITVSLDVNVTVRESGLNITAPTTTTYTWGQNFSTAGLVVKDLAGRTISTYTMKIGSTTITNNTALSNSAFNIGTNSVTIDCTDADGFSQTGFFDITINKATLTVPTQSGSLTYDGKEKTPTWSPALASTLVTITYGSDRTNAGSKTATAALVDSAHYQWTGGTTGNQTLTWSIGKKALASSDVSITGDTSINASNLTREISITLPTGETGAISITPASVSGLTITPVAQNGNTRKYTFKGNGSTALTQKFKVSVGEGKNYLAADFADKFTITATYFGPSELDGKLGNKTWWENLKKWVATASTTDLANCVGKEKQITLTSEVLGTTTHLVRCIGYNVHRDRTDATTRARNTLTFETSNTLATTTVFGSSNGKWTGSTVRTQCQNYYNALPFKDSVCPVSIGTATATNSSQSGSVSYTNENVFLLSDAEHGFPKGADYNNVKGYAASYDEFDQYNTSKTVPQWYAPAAASNLDRRIKKKGDSGSAQSYWERSLRYNDESRACFVSGDGGPNYNTYSGGRGLAPAFVI